MLSLLETQLLTDDERGRAVSSSSAVGQKEDRGRGKGGSNQSSPQPKQLIIAIHMGLCQRESQQGECHYYPITTAPREYNYKSNIGIITGTCLTAEVPPVHIKLM